MKTKTIIITILATLATTYGQDAQPSRRSVVVPSVSPTENNQDPVTLDANYSVTVKGGFGDSKPLDVTLSGNGPKFTASLAGPIRNIEIIVKQKEACFTIQYSIVDQVPITTGTNTSYVSTAITGTYYAALGQQFPVLQVGDKTLSIQIDKIKTNK